MKQSEPAILRSMVINGEARDIAIVSNHDRVGVWEGGRITFYDRSLRVVPNTWEKSTREPNEVEAKQIVALEKAKRIEKGTEENLTSSLPSDAPIGDVRTVQVCGDVDLGKLLVQCECGKYREADRPHAFKRS